MLETQHLPIENKNKVINQDIRTFEASLHEEFNRCDQLRQGNTQIKFEDNNWSWGVFGVIFGNSFCQYQGLFRQGL